MLKIFLTEERNLFVKAIRGHPYVLAMVIRYFGYPQAQKLSLRNTIKKSVDDNAKWESDMDYFFMPTDCIMQYFRYFSNDTKYIRKILMTVDQNQMTLISRIFSYPGAFRLQQFLMYELDIKIRDFIDITKLPV